MKKVFATMAAASLILAMLTASAAEANTIDFATIVADPTTSNPNVELKNTPFGASPQLLFDTTSTVDVDFSFNIGNFVVDNAFNDIPAEIQIIGTGNQAAISTLNYLIQPLSSGDFTIRSLQSVTVDGITFAAGTNLLSGQFYDGDLDGIAKGSTATLVASTSSIQSAVLSFAPSLSVTNSALVNLDNVKTGSTTGFTLNTQDKALNTSKADVANGVFSTNASITVPAISAAPEPDTWVLMLVGFGGIGALLRSRRTCVANVV